MNTVELIKISLKKSDAATQTIVEGKSAGILQSDLEEILRRAASVQLPDSGRINILNLYFHHLPSNACLIARMVPIMNEQGTQTIPDAACLQCLVVSSQALADFGNNPVVLYQTILNSGSLVAFLSKEPLLEPILLRQKNATFDWELVRGLAINPGRHSLVILLESVLDAIETSFSGHVSGVHLLAGLFNLLPVAWRPELTFATGITFREDWGFRIVGIPTENTEMINRCKEGMLPYFDLDEISRKQRVYPVVDGWAILVNQILLDESLSFFVPRLLKARFNSGKHGEDSFPAPESINRLGFRWLEEYGKQSKQDKAESDTARHMDLPAGSASDDDRANLEEDTTGSDVMDFAYESQSSRSETKAPSLLESNLPYPGHTPSMLPHELPLFHYEAGNRIFSPYQRLLAQAPEHRDLLLQLDSLVGHVLKYEPSAVETLRRFWKDLHVRLDDGMIWAIREEYIHYVQTSLMCNGDDESTPARKSLFTLEILDILVN